jgi:hypothetical protein
MKRKWNFEPDEFFIGYLPEVPQKTAAFLRWVLIVVGLVIVMISVVLVTSQQSFSPAQFDYGNYTTVEGHIFSYPVPHLKIYEGSDTTGNLIYQTLLLVGFGKAGGNKTLAKFESKLGTLEGKFVKISGELIRGHGKALLQLSVDRIPEILELRIPYKKTVLNDEGMVYGIKGEIVDPKCFFGVMKPGEGKPHRSCAIRCISGGIPPVFHAAERSDYFLVLDERFQPVNQYVLDLVGDDIELQGKVVQWDDWKILLVDSKNLKDQAVNSRLTRNLATMEIGITLCESNE